MKNKTTKELYDIATDSLNLDTDSKNMAVAELEKRKLSLSDTARIKNKIELESLIKEQSRRPGSADHSISLTYGIATMVMVLIILLIDKSAIGKIIAAIGFIAISILTIYNFLKLRKKKRVESLRTARIYELINEIY